MRTLLLLACLAVLTAAEADPKVQAKALWTAAAKAGDPWTCLQLEAWARKLKPALRLGNVLGDSLIVGDPLFALPEHIEGLYDFGERVVVTTSKRAYVFAPDGRPLQISVSVPRHWQRGINYGGTVLAVLSQDKREVRIVTVRLADGAQILSTNVQLAEEQQLEGNPVVADDGSAVVFACKREDAPGGRVTQTIMQASSGGGGAKPIDVPVNLLGIGRKAAWLLAGWMPNGVLVVGDRRRTVTAAAVGPGIAACIHEGKVLLVAADGSDVQLNGAPAIGDNPGLATVGSWLVLASGSGAKVVSQGDLLGDGAGVVTVQPPTLAFWRWADLAADPTAKPVSTSPGTLSPATMLPAALWAWQDKDLDLIDLSGAEPRRETFLQATAPIEWVSCSQHCVRLHHGGGRLALHDMDKREVWSGTANQSEVKRHDLALLHRVKDGHHSWSLATLSSDPAKRTEVRLDLPDQEQSVVVSLRSPDVVVARAERGWWRSLGLDGKVTMTARAAGPKAVPAPRCEEWNWFTPNGRFYRDGARVRGKAAAPSDDPIAELRLADAWRVGSTAILLETSGRVLVTAPKRGAWIELPPVASADRFALAGSSLVLAAGDALRPVATLLPGPKLEARASGGSLTSPPPGPWRIERNWRFTPPRANQLEWDDDRLDWRPIRLRSPDGGNMLVITPAVLIELDPSAAKQFGK